MAFRALALAGARLELPLVRIDGMAIVALGKGQFFLEFAAGVTPDAAHFDVRAQQRVIRFGMVELHRGTDLLPTRRGVAGLAGSFERALVRIAVAVIAGLKFDARKLHGFLGAGREVALFAGHLHVLSGQRIFGFGVVEILGLFPVGHIVAGLAIGAELPFVDVFMAGHAILREAHVGGRQILLFNQVAQCRKHVRRGVALLASDRRVFFHQRISCQAMIELF